MIKVKERAASARRLVYFIPKILFLLFFVYMLYLGFFFAFQKLFLFPRYLIPSVQVDLSEMKDLQSTWLETGDYKTELWFMKAAMNQHQGRRPAFIIAHGNAQMIDHWLKRIPPLRAMGIHVLLVEYPGYGRSGGAPSFKSISRSFIQAYDWLVARQDVDPERIFFFGYSLGAGAVTALAAQRPAAAIILLATFTSVYDIARGLLLPPFLVREPFDNITPMRFFKGPVLILYAKQDKLFPLRHALQLYRAANKAYLLSYEGSHRKNIYDWQSFWQGDVKKFLITYQLLN